MKISIINKIVGAGLLLLNLYWLPATISIIFTGGGTWGIGLIALPFTFFLNLFVITALLVYRKKFENSYPLLILNSIIFILYSFLTYSILFNTKTD